jgi:hypothetical protein
MIIIISIKVEIGFNKLLGAVILAKQKPKKSSKLLSFR